MFIEGERQLKDIVTSYSGTSFIINDDLINSLLHHDIVQYLSLQLISDYQIELFLTDLRKHLLSMIVNNQFGQLDSKNLCLLLTTLSHQCFNTEYVFFITEQEITDLEKIKQQLNTTQNHASIYLLLISCYQVLNTEKTIKDHAVSLQTDSPDFEAVIKRQITDLEIEQTIKHDIKVIGAVPDAKTDIVKQHYETNPYPRWFVAESIAEQTIDAYISKSLCYLSKISSHKIIAKKILVAGCGTGWLTVQHAKRFPDCEVIGIDLSLSSLSYAKRMTLALKLNNIEFIQMDLMQIGKLDLEFDYIDCIGVLPHVAEPKLCCDVLLKQLSSQGVLRFSLYSRLARKTIRQAADYIKKKHLMRA